MNSNFSANVISRLKKEIGVQRDSELSDLMNLNRSTVSTWRKNDSINLRKIHESFPHISIDYLLGLKESNVVEESDKRAESHQDSEKKIETLNAQIEVLQQTIRQLCK